MCRDDPSSPVSKAREGGRPPSEARSAQPAGARLPPQLDAAQPQADAQPDGDHRREAAGEQRGLPEVRRHGALVVPDAICLEHALAHDDLLKEADGEAHHRRAAVPRLGALREANVGLAQIATITSHLIVHRIGQAVVEDFLGEAVLAMLTTPARVTKRGAIGASRIAAQGAASIASTSLCIVADMAAKGRT
eukprot:CAMPEP_0118816750 /NCGR_PEP_ID=MMETSP1162-20130426/4974_1 /TAXON_ID=33656 /ORGANISM="Phaeocystis Sp, Strain CCMP2710" /LENGTH=191 /DNA_ID=CAMNT_0006746787 /DNA_START=124 /DNA_END=696 /DNA_ORIENTATION=+